MQSRLLKTLKRGNACRRKFVRAKKTLPAETLRTSQPALGVILTSSVRDQLE